MTKLAPVTLPARGEARTVTSVATSAACEPPGGDAGLGLPAHRPGSTPVAAPIVAATPSSPSHRSVATGPGETLLMRMPLGPSSCDSAFARFSSAALAAP